MKIVLIILSVLLVAGFGLGAGFIYVQHQQISDLQFQVSALSKQQTQIKSLKSELSKTQSIQRQVVKTLNQIVALINSVPDSEPAPSKYKPDLRNNGE